ncbi:CIA30-domain-containing protein [Conidiobolus coronatus NRRL 28638]|uniref:CIA30-domain-containing protein n=1 Tax=Conidiobolus coronatus (strain ATCC 28846 / CBS 209.66 / NRRL 28638) TaxID=796925 RepID=A0A137PAR4_CONC2|nr:CIA30-domain-containing protein [Conidiobolus coronatus NRRL 28638]|eukprot:KXN72103.1 CIA30-domain-containing protein [Conidiobolus coronatus NRRL 28638]
MSLLNHFLSRYTKNFKSTLNKVKHFDDIIDWRKEFTLTEFKKEEDTKDWLVGCDRDIGGKSEANLVYTKNNTGLFTGFTSNHLPEHLEIKVHGYAALRTKDDLFSDDCLDTSPFRYLLLRVKGDHRKYMVNIQTDGIIQTDIYQHRLFLKTPNQWENVLIPFNDFTLTNDGNLEPNQTRMFREKVKTVGIGLIDRQEGEFNLEIESIKCFNTEYSDGDVDKLPETPITI